MAQIMIKSLEMDQVGQAAKLVAGAFEQDPLITWVFPSRQDRQRKIAELYGQNIAYAVRHGRVDTTESLEGLAIWLQPGQTRMTLGRLMRVGVLATPFRLGWRSLLRIGAYTRRKARLHKQVMGHAQPHWYLLAIAVDPGAQGRGLGKQLVQPVFGQADRDGLACYLETANQSNVSFFEKLGFVVQAQDQVPQGGPGLWAMVRPARTSPQVR